MTDRYVEQVTEASRLRAHDLILLALQDRDDEAEVLISTVPENELRALLVGCLAHAAVAYKKTVGPEVAIAFLDRTSKRRSKRA